MTQPRGRGSDTGLMYRGWQRTASEALMHAVSDDDPRCVLTFCAEAEEAAELAVKAASNPRQIAMSQALISAAHNVRDMAQNRPEQM